MTTGSPFKEHSKIIAVTTGTKCIEGDFMSEKGLALNDCHAEILATRCVRDFLYTELDKLVIENGVEMVDLVGDNATEESIRKAEEKSSIFEVDHDCWEGGLKFKLKENVRFHLYISTSPCGDARLVKFLLISKTVSSWGCKNFVLELFRFLLEFSRPRELTWWTWTQMILYLQGMTQWRVDQRVRWESLILIRIESIVEYLELR